MTCLSWWDVFGVYLGECEKAGPTKPVNQLVTYTHTPESFLMNSSILAFNRSNAICPLYLKKPLKIG